ncbi:hypothetical protein [Corynebacterium sp.]|uniref:hypothetical protein n=1 Tax=Corynebacterium sp. TaxID=1720 RepID=UPI0026E035C7|nr:hypothetical protein [Corynebacterium sp.]MDO5512430.1 hypothetical protein [Corynebacterium sp.]
MNPQAVHSNLSDNLRLAVVVLLTLALATSRFLPSTIALVILGFLAFLSLSLPAVLWWLRRLIRLSEGGERSEEGEREESSASPPPTSPDEVPLGVEELDSLKMLLQRQLGGTGSVIPVDVEIGPKARRFLQAEGMSWSDIHAQLGGAAHHDTMCGDHRFLLPDLEVITDQRLTFVKHVGFRTAVPAESASPTPAAPSHAHKKRHRSRVPGTKHDPRLPVPTSRGDLIRRLKERGFEVTQGRKHTKITHPDYPSRLATMPTSPSDRRWIHNQLRDIKHEFGIDLRSPEG